MFPAKAMHKSCLYEWHYYNFHIYHVQGGQRILSFIIQLKIKNVLTHTIKKIHKFNYTADTTRTFTYAMHNRDNRKLGIFSLILHRQHIQFGFLTGKRRTFIHTMHSRDKAKSIFSFQRERQCIKPNFMTDTINTFMHIIPTRQRKFWSTYIQTTQ